MILIYPGKDGNRLDEYQKVLQDYELAFFGDELEEKTMADIIAQASKDNQRFEGKREPFLFFVKEDPKKLGSLMTALEQQGLDTTHTAILTDTNKDWKFKDLYKEINREAEYFKKREVLANVVSSADPDRIMKDEQYGKLMLTFYEMLKAPQLEEEILDMALQAAASLK